MTPRAHALANIVLCAALVAVLTGVIAVQRADYHRLEQARRDEMVRIVELLGRKAVLVTPVDMGPFENAAAGQKGGRP